MSSKKYLQAKFPLIAFTALATLSSGCGSNNASTNTASDASGSVSEAAVASVGGAVASTSTDAVAWMAARKQSYLASLLRSVSPIPEALAGFGRCPTAVNSYSGSCSVSGHSMTLTFPSQGCIYGPGVAGALWEGGTVLTTGASDSDPACGTFPTINGSTITSVTRTYLGNLDSNPTFRSNPAGTQTVVVDTSAPSSIAFASAKSASPTSGTIGWEYSIAGGGGYERSFVSSSSDNLAITVRTVGYHSAASPRASADSSRVEFDHTLSTTDSKGVSTPLNIAVSGSGTQETQTVNGTIHLQHNLMKMTASVNLANLVHPYGCCYPNSGKITTTFSGGPNDGKQESMEFSAETCTLGTMGQVTFTDINGNVSTKTLTHCL